MVKMQTERNRAIEERTLTGWRGEGDALSIEWCPQ